MNKREKLEQQKAIAKAKLDEIEREQSRLWGLIWGIDFAIRLLATDNKGLGK